MMTSTKTLARLRLLSLGAGVQSTTLLLLAAEGRLPKLDGAIFSDTGKATTSSTAKKTAAAKKTTAPRTRKAATAKKTTPPSAPTPRLSLVKPADLRAGLPTRARGWMTDTQGPATLAARLVGIPTRRIRDWRDHRDQTATRALVDGSLLHYTLATRTLAWHALCPQGAIHAYTLTSPSTAAAARVHADRCKTAHTCLLYTSPSPRDLSTSRMPSSA